MKRVIVESPYAGDIDRNTIYARRASRFCLDQGETPFASHLIYTQPGILDEHNPDERKLGIEAGYEWWDAAEAIVVFIDYGISDGMRKALRRAAGLNKPVIMREIGLNP